MNASAPTRNLDEPNELHRFLTAYRPSNVAASIWLGVAKDVIDLVARAGELTRLRVEKDIQCVGHVVAHLVDRGRPVSLEEVLDDRTLLSYDAVLQRRSPGGRTRENQRGILRRLQAVHRDLPWRQPRRTDGARVTDMVQPSALDALLHVEAAARWHASEPTSTLQRDAATFLTVLGTARSARGLVTTSQPGGVAQQPEEDECWSIARQFAADCSMNLTRPVLAAAMTYELLDQVEPIAVLISTHQLTRRDLDLALAQAQHLPCEPEPESRRLLRGPQHSQTLAN